MEDARKGILVERPEMSPRLNRSIAMFRPSKTELDPLLYLLGGPCLFWPCRRSLFETSPVGMFQVVVVKGGEIR